MAEHRGGICLRRLRISAVLLGVSMLAAGCASQSAQKHLDAELVQFDEWLPGRYDNQVQIATDTRAGRPPPQPLALSVVPVDALQMGHHVFYVEETAGHIEAPGAPRLILAQHLATIQVVNGKIVAALYSFTDPQRWRDGIAMPELFSSLQPQDVKLMRGCGLTWTVDPHKLSATDEESHCLTSSALTGSIESLRIRVELTRDEIDVRAVPAETSSPSASSSSSSAPGSSGSVDSSGSNSAADDDSYTHFRRSGGL